MRSLEELRTFVRYHLVHRPYDHPVRGDVLGNVELDYEPHAYAARLRSYAPRFDVVVRGEIEHRGERLPIFVVSSRPVRPDARLLVLAGVHGNERAGLLAVPPILDAHDRAGAPASRVALTIVTPVNPVGAARFSRFNGEGFDVNRDFRRFETREACLVRAIVDEARPDLVVSLHEGPQDASFVFANPCVDLGLARRVLGRLAREGTKLAEVDYFGRRLVPAGLAATSRLDQGLVALWGKLFGMAATSEFANARGIPELTLESSWRNPDADERIGAHVGLVRALVDELAGAGG